LNFFVEKGDDSKKLVCLVVYWVEEERSVEVREQMSDK